MCRLDDFCCCIPNPVFEFGHCILRKIWPWPTKEELLQYDDIKLLHWSRHCPHFSTVFGSIRIIFGPFDASNSFEFLVVLNIFFVFNFLCLLEVGIYRALAAYFPNVIIGMNDDFFHCFFNCWNLMMAFIISITINWDIAAWTPLENYGYVSGYIVSDFIGQEPHINYEM